MSACSHTPVSVSMRTVKSHDARCFNCRRGRGLYTNPNWLDGFKQFLPGLVSKETDGRNPEDAAPLPSRAVITETLLMVPTMLERVAETMERERRITRRPARVEG